MIIDINNIYDENGIPLNGISSYFVVLNINVDIWRVVCSVSMSLVSSLITVMSNALSVNAYDHRGIVVHWVSWVNHKPTVHVLLIFPKSTASCFVDFF